MSHPSILDRRWGEGEVGLRYMCDTGVRLLGEYPEYEALRFDCFNEAEADFVATYMRENHAGVEFHTTHIVFGAAA